MGISGTATSIPVGRKNFPRFGGQKSKRIVAATSEISDAYEPLAGESSGFGRALGSAPLSSNSLTASMSPRKIAHSKGVMPSSTSFRLAPSAMASFIAPISEDKTAFANLLDPLPKEHCPMAEPLRPGFTASDPVVKAALDPLLLEQVSKSLSLEQALQPRA